MFVDYTKIKVKAGDGGNGAMTFHREKYVDSGGPDGGDGGHGGSIIFKVHPGMNTLLNFSYNKKIEAKNGENGAKKNCTGKSAEDVYIDVPKGTVVRDLSTGKVIADLATDDAEAIIAKGGRGGKGNQHFANSIRQAPRFSEQGEPGEEKDLELELKLIADVGLVGFPNVGKSTIISTVSSAKPKIANYHFTTLEPSLGVVRAKDGTTFVMADIPGIIEGASEGVGLGIKFLRHVERNRILLHVIDVSGSENRDPIDDYYTINVELRKFSEKLANKPQIIVANKSDVLQDDAKLDELKEACRKDGRQVISISAATRENIDELIELISKTLKELPEDSEQFVDEEIFTITLDKNKEEDFYIEIIECEYVVKGPAIDRLMRRVNVEDFESRQYMQRALKNLGVMDKLREMDIESGDTVDIKGFKFNWEE